MPTKEQLIQALVDSMIPMSDDQVFYRLMLYGEGGVGKTKLATDFGTRILYIESDPLGWVTLINHPENRRKCTRMVYEGLSQLDTLVAAWQDGNEAFTQYDLIVVDTLSAIATLDLDTVTAAREKAGTRKMGAFEPVSQPDYGVNTERVRRTVMDFVTLPVNMVFTAHPREEEVVGLKITRPNFSAKMRKDITRMMTLVGYMTIVEGKETDDGEPTYVRKMQVHPTKTIDAKSRIGGLPVVLSDYDLPKIVNDWIAAGSQEVDETEILDDKFGLNNHPVTISDSESATEALEI